MDIIFKGTHSTEELANSVFNVLRLFKDRYHVPTFREIHLTVTLLDESGQDVELVDNQSSDIYRTFEVYRENCSELRQKEHPTPGPGLKLVVDNTPKK